MTRPPLISTDMRTLLPRTPDRALGRPGPESTRLLSAWCDGDRDRLVALAVHVHTLGLEGGNSLPRPGVVRRSHGRLLDHAVLLRDLRRVRDRRRRHEADPARVRPDELVDLVHLPELVAVAERRPVLQHDVRAVGDVVTTVDPAFQRRLE